MNNPDFVYTTYIKTSPQKVWDAIITPEFTRQYWGVELHSDWKKGSRWTHIKPGDAGKISMEGEVLESVAPSKLVMSWADCDNPGNVSQVAFEIETVADMVRLTVLHTKLDAVAGGKISRGWPRVLSSMKSFLETGTALDTWAA